MLGPEAYFDVIHDLSDDLIRVLLVGHNPGLEEVVDMLTGEIQLMPTCSLAHVKQKIEPLLALCLSMGFGWWLSRKTGEVARNV